MKYLYLDFETRMTKNLKLSKMTTRSYCEETDVTMLAWALDDEPVQYQLGTPNDHTLGLLRAAAESEDTCFVAFNASFDIRVLHITLDLPYPKHFLCALELSRAAWPNQPGGYSLDNLAVQLGLKYKKIKVDLEEVSGPELIDYCKMDVEVLREVFKLEQSILPPEEFRVCELSNRAKTITFSIDTKRVLEAVENMSKMAGDAALDVAHAFGDDPEILKAYGWHGDRAPDSIEAAKKMTPKSVKPAKVKELLLSRLNIDFITTGKSTSIKQINPAELARMPDQAQVLLKKGGELGRALSHRRSLAKFSGLQTVDCELSYAAAHTLRFASRNEGCKGLNLHNCISLRTLVLTDCGWVRIVDVTTQHLVWDGEAFVDHSGVTYEGDRECLTINNCQLTPEHPVFQPERVDATLCHPVRAAAHGLLSILYCLQHLESGVSRPAAGSKRLETGTTPGSLNVADPAITWTDAQLTTLARAWTSLRSTGSAMPPWGTGVALLGTPDSCAPGTGSAPTGGNYQTSSSTAKLYLGGMINDCKWIALTPTETMFPETSGLFLRVLTAITAELQSAWPVGSSSPTTLSGSGSNTSEPTTYTDKAVFDIRGAGPRARFQAGGLLVANCPKHDKRIAEPFRRSFVLPEGYVWVCGDFANVEYRGEGLITGCEFVLDMFGKNPFADPYSAFGEWATGLTIDRSTSIGKALRQLFKAAVLGLGYMMGLRTWMVQLLKVLASGSVTLDDLRNLASEKHWRRCSSWAQKAIKELGCEEIVGIVGEHIHELFHQRHPEFAKFGRWMEGAVSRLSYAHNPDAVLAELYQLPGAPNRSVLDMSVDRRLGGSSIRASTSGYPASVCWRDLAIRESSRGPCLTSVLAGHKSPRPITPNILIENFVQYWARTALVIGQAQLEDLGHPLQLSIHDEAKILCKAEPQAILNARADLLQVFGPGNNLGFGWAIMVDPATVTVSRSLWDDEAWCQKVFWPRLESGDESVLGELT